MRKTFLIVFILSISLIAQDKISIDLRKKIYENPNADTKQLVWVFFKDKTALYFDPTANPLVFVSQRSLNRRAKVKPANQLIDETDIRVNSSYVQAVLATGFQLKNKSKWFNGISGYATAAQIEAIQSLACVVSISPVKLYKKITDIKSNANVLAKTNLNVNSKYNYGYSLPQMQQINVPAVHDLGLTASNVMIGSFDAGFSRLQHPVFSNMKIIAKWDFVNNDADVADGTDMGEGSHGTETLSSIGGFSSGNLIGPAFGASYVLAKTENTNSETPAEEDNWIAAIEWADSIGIDISTTSLGYLEYDSPFTSYTWANMDGKTARITRAADMAVSKGIAVFNSAGNEGSNTSHNTLGAPADAFNIITVGAVTSSGVRSSFSSVGPTADGRIKPEIMTMGSSVRVASPYDNTYTYSDGTSFSCPIAAGAGALVLSAHPGLTPAKLKEVLTLTASNSETPNNSIGYGIINTLEAIKSIEPSYIHEPLTNTNNVNRQNIVKVKVTSIDSIKYVYLFYCLENAAKYDSLKMQLGTDGQYQAQIPINLDKVTVKYYIKTNNGTVLYSTSPANAPNNVYSFAINTLGKNVPANFELYLNYPNPFNPTTNIKYSLAKTSEISLKLYDVLGHLISILQEGIYSSGEHLYSLRAQGLSSGTYFVVLENGNESQKIKINLVK